MPDSDASSSANSTTQSAPTKKPIVGKAGCALCVFFMICGPITFVIPTIKAAREAARRSACTNNLKQLEMAILNYADSHGQFPPAYTVDKDGNPLHSWRTLLLPFIGEPELYEKLKLDEPWNSPDNLAILENLPMDAYRCPSNPENNSDGNTMTFTNYVMVLGPNCVSDGPNACRFRDLVNGAANTIHITETIAPIRWFEPKDASIEDIDDIAAAPTTIDSYHPFIVMAAFCDGSVQPISQGIDPATLRALFEGKVKNDTINMDFDSSNY